MALRWAAALLCLVSLAAAHSIPQPSAASQQPSEASQQSSAADQLSALLAPVVEAAVSRALAAERAAQQQCALPADAGQRALLERLLKRPDVLIRDVTAPQAALATVQGATTAARGEDRTQGLSASPPEPEPEPVCEPQPAPLLAGSASYREPERRACASSCLQLRNQGGSPQDGVYWFTGMPVPVLCDFSHDGGGWTLLLTSVSQHGWDPFSVRERNKKSPSLTDNYSILEYADTIRDMSISSRFAYRIEAQAEKGRQHWGGIWFAPRHYSFVDETGSQTDISLVRRFDNWNYKHLGIQQRMPWINTRGNHKMSFVLTTTMSRSADWWGTLVTHISHTGSNKSPWISSEAPSSGTVLYWMKEDIANV